MSTKPLSERCPSVSVVIPTYNSAKHVHQALASVNSQSYLAAEIIVVDDASSDETVATARRCANVTRIVQRLERGGAGAARNDGVACARGSLVAFLDADDYWAPDKLEHQVRAFADDPGVSMAICTVSEFHDPELSERDKAAFPLRTLTAPIPSAILISKTAFYRVGQFDADQGAGSEALTWALAAKDAGISIASVRETIVYRRIHANNGGRVNRERQHRGYLLALKAALDRRRAADSGCPHK